MFRSLAKQASISTPNAAQILVSLHPAQLTALLETAWNFRVHLASNPTGHPDHRSDMPGLNISQMPLPSPVPLTSNPVPDPAEPFTAVLRGTFPKSPPGVRWDHLIYAYMIENTRIVEVFRRVVDEFLHGEKFGAPQEDTQPWLRNTEELFFRDPPPFSISTLTSYIRPDIASMGREAYYRMFGMDLNHGKDDNSPYPYVKVDAANKEFITTFEELLRETWIGFINRSTTSGANPTDDAKIADLARKLNNMLSNRRQFGNLSREEFYLAAKMSWFHMTVENTSLPIIRDLRAKGNSPEQVLFRIAQMVGLPANGLADHYFCIAEDISAILIAIETGAFQTPGAARAFYDPAASNTMADKMNNINNHLAAMTGHDLKGPKVTVR